MPILYRDYETRSTVELGDVGAHIYAAHDSTDVWCCAYAVDDGPVQLWTPGMPVPPEFFEAAANPDWLMSAFNDQFERLIEQHIMAPRYGWPPMPIERHRCTQAAALALALPANLAGVGTALSLEYQKDESGHRLMLQMSRPRKPRKGEDPNGIYWVDDAEKSERLYAYCRRDVETERAAHKRIGFLPAAEQKVWQLDASINDRGIHLDGQLLAGALHISSELEAEIDCEIAKVTGGAVATINEVAKLIAWLRERGCEVPDVRKKTLQAALANGAAPEVRRAMELRLAGAHAAARKLHTMQAWRDVDGRARGGLKYHVASTGRWGSWGMQLHNLKRPTTENLNAAITAVSSGSLQPVKQQFTDPMSVIGDLGRAIVCAAPGHRFIAADFSGVESRITAWLAGEQRKVDQWARFDVTGNPKDEPYYLLGIKLGQPEEEARAKGKVGDLAFGYMGSVGAYRALDHKTTLTDEEIQKLKYRWRDEHPQIVKFWKMLTRASVRAMQRPGTTVACERVSFTYDGEMFLRMRLPSGRDLAYPAPRLITDMTYGEPAVVFKDNAKGKFVDCRDGRGAYGGTWIENAVQAVARDLFVEALARLEAASYPVVLHVHDEIVCELPVGVGTKEEFHTIMTTAPDWAAGLPIAAKAHNSTRFAKIKDENASLHAAEPIQVRQPDANSAPEPEILQQNSQTPPWVPDEESPMQLQNGKGAPVVNAPVLDITPFTSNRAHHSSDGNVHGDTGPQRGRRTAQFFYPHLDGSEYLRVDRYDGDERQFFQHHWDDKRKQWKIGVKGTYAERKIPYRLSELKAALLADPNVQVHIAEGESDANALAQLGLVVTTNPGGALSWTPELTDWLRVLGVRKAVIHEDNDGEAHEFKGQKRTALLTKELSGFIKLKVVRYPDVPEGEDVRYWLEHGGHTKEELGARIAAAGSARPPFTWLNMSKWDSEPVPERKWAIHDRVPLNQAGLCSGEGGVGKSIVELMKDVATVMGLEWYGVIPARGPAFYVGGEDDEDEVHIRLADIANYHGLSFEELIRNGLHVKCMLGRDMTLCAPMGKSGRVEVTDFYRALYEQAGDIKPKNISIDTLTRAFAGSEIDRVQVYAFAMHMQALAMVAGGAVTVLSHPSLQGMSSGSGLSGSTAWHGAFRFRQYLVAAKPEAGELPDPNIRELQFKKTQYAAIGESIVVEYRNGLFLPVSGASMDQATRKAQAQDAFIEILRRFTKDRRQVSSTPCQTYAPTLFAQEAEARQAKLKAKDLAEAMRQLFAADKIENVAHGPLSKQRFHLAIKGGQ
jgi:DNA polymerase bacteriophage-type